MVKFIGVLGVGASIVILLTLLWPRFSPNPRPAPLEKIHDILLSTEIGKNAANVLGVSDDQSVVPLTPQSVSQQIIMSVRNRVSDVIITNAVRIISQRFKDLPIDQQEKVINAFSQAISEPTSVEASPSQNLSNPAQ